MTRLNLDEVTDDIWSLIHPTGYLTRIRRLLPEPGTPGQSESSTSHKVIGSPAPWNDEAAGILFDVHAGARQHEKRLRVELGFGSLRRGPTDRATRAALFALADLVRAAHTRHLDSARPEVERTARDLNRWARICRRILDDDPNPNDITVTHAPGNLKCPGCGRRLVLKPGWQYEQSPSLWCLRCPDSRDDDNPHGVDLSWPATEWIAMLQDDTA